MLRLCFYACAYVALYVAGFTAFLCFAFCFSVLFFCFSHGNVSLRFCIVYCSQRNREQPAHYLKQYKNAGKCFRVYGDLEVQRLNAIMVDRGRIDG